MVSTTLLRALLEADEAEAPQGSAATKQTEREGLGTVDCSEGCPTAAVILGVLGVRVLSAERDEMDRLPR